MTWSELLSRKVEPTAWPVLVAVTRLLTPELDLGTHDPVLVLGNQKTGSTAIAKLLARRGELRACTDIHPLQAPGRRVPHAPAEVRALVQRLRYYFRRDLVKENELTPATEALLAIVPQARPVFVVRHPVQNVRSILDRVGLPGRPLPFDDLSLSPGGWNAIVRGRDLEIEADDHITALAKRWAVTTDIYLRNQERLHLVRYEDFVADKRGTIDALADRLGIPTRANIEALLDVPFQPRGVHRSTPVDEVFSSRALELIAHHCEEGMRALDYTAPPARHD